MKVRYVQEGVWVLSSKLEDGKSEWGYTPDGSLPQHTEATVNVTVMLGCIESLVSIEKRKRSGERRSGRQAWCCRTRMSQWQNHVRRGHDRVTISRGSWASLGFLGMRHASPGQLRP